jgi:hypothetical protein
VAAEAWRADEVPHRAPEHRQPEGPVRRARLGSAHGGEP